MVRTHAWAQQLNNVIFQVLKVGIMGKAARVKDVAAVITRGQAIFTCIQINYGTYYYLDVKFLV